MTITHAAYFDASGKRDGYPVLTVAGAASSVKKWKRFESQWSAILKREGIAEFHATDFAASLGEYTSWKGKKEKRSKFLRDLHAVIKTNVNRLFMVTVEIDAWTTVNKEYMLEEAFHSPYALAAYSVAMQAHKWAQNKGAERSIEFVFEDGEDKEDWSGLKKLCSHSGWKITPIRLPKEKAIPCQVGDLVAWKNRIAATNSLVKLKKIEDADYPDWESLQGIKDEMASMWGALNAASPHPGVYSPRALAKTCKDSHVRLRSNPKIVTAL